MRSFRSAALNTPPFNLLGIHDGGWRKTGRNREMKSSECKKNFRLPVTTNPDKMSSSEPEVAIVEMIEVVPRGMPLWPWIFSKMSWLASVRANRSGVAWRRSLETNRCNLRNYEQLNSGRPCDSYKLWTVSNVTPEHGSSGTEASLAVC